MRPAGTGPELYSVRVDLFTDAEDPNAVVGDCADALCDVLDIPRGEWKRGEIGVDRGIGTEGRPVIGFLFWVRGHDIGDAARTALDTARAAGSRFEAGPGFFDVALVPVNAVVLSDEPFPRMTD
jgi:hypothetical protein